MYARIQDGQTFDRHPSGQTRMLQLLSHGGHSNCPVFIQDSPDNWYYLLCASRNSKHLPLFPRMVFDTEVQLHPGYIPLTDYQIQTGSLLSDQENLTFCAWCFSDLFIAQNMYTPILEPSQSSLRTAPWSLIQKQPAPKHRKATSLYLAL